jgi:uncharacterized repeat protein (TIGR01451 family)
MRIDRVSGSRVWLFGIVIFLLVAVVAVVWTVGSPRSLAAPVPQSARARQAAAAGSIAAQEPMTYTLFMPALVNNFEPARLVVDKQVWPTSLIAGPGQVVTYTVTISNAGDTTGTLLSVVDTLPAGFVLDGMADGSDVVTLPDGTSGTITWSGSWSLAPDQAMAVAYRVIAGQEPGVWSNQVLVTAQAADVPQAPAVAEILIQPAILLAENFETGIGRWTEFLNHHRLEPGQWYYGASDGVGGSGGLTHDCCTGSEVASDALMMYLQPGAQEWTDYRAEARMYLTGGVDKYGNIRPTGGDPIGFWIRGHYQEVTAPESQWVSGYYVVIVGESNDPTHFVRIAKIQQPGDCEACLKPDRMYNFDNPMFKARSADLPGPFEHYRWYTLAVEVRGANIKVFLDGELVLDWTDPLLPFTSGTVGFKVHETRTATFDDVIVTPLR